MKKHNIRGLNVIEFGEETKPSIIFIHAFPLCNRMWDKQTEALKNDYRVIVYDIRGFGYSDFGDGYFTIDMHVSDLISITDSLKLDKPVICGLSMGGYIALRALELYQSKFSGAILADTKSESDNNHAKINRSEQMKLIKNGQREQFTENFIKSAISETNYNEKPEIAENIRKIISWQKSEVILGTLLTLSSRLDMTESLDKFELPILVIAGKEDKLTPPEFSKIIYGKTRNSELKIIQNAGHLSNLENPEEFNATVSEFMKSLSKVPAE